MANNTIIPPIGSRGKFEFSSPFDTALTNSQEYIVKGIRLLTEIQDSQDDPYTNIYQPVGLSQDDFKNDLDNNVPIIVLSNGGSEYYYVPASKLKTMPQTVGVKYQEVALTVNLGYLPLNFNLDLAKDTIIADIKGTLGITSTAEVVKTSTVQLATEQEDKKFMQLLDAAKTTKSSYRTLYYALLELYNNQNARLKIYEDYFIQQRSKSSVS